MAVDNRTQLNACDADTDAWAGDGGATDNSEAGNFYEGGISQGVTLSNALEREVCRTIGGTRDLSDSQVWVVVKDGLASSRAAGGFQVVIEDAADEIGFFVGGFDFLPMALPSFFWSLRLDVSESGVFDTASETTAYGGSFAGLDETSIIGVGYGTIHAAKAKSENAYIDGLYFIANGSYATTIDAGTVGTPDTFALVVADDETNGTGTWSNLQGSKFDTNASWEWGVSANQDSYFDDSDFQVFIDANDVGAGNFIVRANCGTGTNLLRLTGGLFQNLGTGSIWDLSDTDYDTLELELVTWNNIGTMSLPSSGGTSRYALTCTWANCGTITSNGCDMTGSSILAPNITANDASLVWNENSDPNGELDDLTFTKTSGVAHHAIEFGTSIPTSAITLTGINFGTDFSGSENTSPTAEAGDETFAFRDTTGTLTVNLVGCTGNFGYYSAGVVITKVVDPVDVVLTNVTEGTPVTIIAAETVGTITDGDVLLAAFADSSGGVSLSFDYEGAFDPSGLDVKVRARNQGVAVAAIAEDGGAFVDETDEAHSNATADMTLLPAVPVASDAYNFGHSEQFARLKLNISTALTQSSAPTFAFEYWNGAWTALSGVVDGTAGYENSGENIISWTMPGDWATTTINSQGPLYYMRIRITAVGTITQVPVGARVQLDVTRYLPYLGARVITSSGLADVASWAVDSISKFDPDA